MFSRSARFYDAIYSGKDYPAEVARLLELVGGTPGGEALDVACGTGLHAQILARHYEVTGLDLDPELLDQARLRVPSATFVVGDMRRFDLGKKFDLVTCLFSSIGYVETDVALRETCAALVRHARPGGTVVVEPWLRQEMLRPGHVGLEVAEAQGFKVARMSSLSVEDQVSVVHFHYLIGGPAGVRHETEEHRLGLFSLEQYRAALEQAGCAVEYDQAGLTGRGLFLGRVPA